MVNDIKYEYLDHTADAKFRAFGKDLEETFINSAKATFGILIDCKDVKPNISKDIDIKSKRLESLLYDFIEELLYLLDIDGFLLSKVDNLIIKKVGDNLYSLSCTVFGDKYNNYKISGNVKSVTYNDMEIKKTDVGYQITMVVDI